MSTEIPKDAREVYCNDKGEPIAYCPVDGLGATDLARATFYQEQDHDRLQSMRRRALELGERVVICIDVDDPAWRPLVDALMPDADWQSIRDRGERPIARGVVPLAMIADLVADTYPAAGKVETVGSIVVFAAGGVLIVNDKVT